MATDLMNAHPDLTGLVGECTSSAPGVAQAVRDAGQGRPGVHRRSRHPAVDEALPGERLVDRRDPVGRREPRLPDRVDRRPARGGQAVRRDERRQPGAVRRSSTTRAARPCSSARPWRSPRRTWTSSTTESARSRRAGTSAGTGSAPIPTTESEDASTVDQNPPRRRRHRPPQADRAPRLRLTGVSKRFGAVRAIRNGDITIRVGRRARPRGGERRRQVHDDQDHLGGGVRGHRDDRVRGAPGRPSRTTSDAMALGIATVYQEPQLFPELTVSENIFTGREIRKGGRVAWAEQNAKVVELLELLGLPAKLRHRARRRPLDRRAAAGVDREGARGRRDGADPRRAVGDPDRRRDRRALRRRPPADGVGGVGHLHLPPARRAVPHRRRGDGDARRADHRHVPDRAN